MGTRRRRSHRSGRGVLRSSGRPSVVRREGRRRFWVAVAAGLSSEDAAAGAGVSPTVGTRWFRAAGGMPPAPLAPSSKPLSGRYLSFAEREEIALWRAQGLGVREIACRLGRAASTISREVRRNAATRGGGARVKNGPALAGHGTEAVGDAITRPITTLPEQLTTLTDLGSGSGDDPGRTTTDRHWSVSSCLLSFRFSEV